MRRTGNSKHELICHAESLHRATATVAAGCPAVCAFVDDQLDGPTLAALAAGGTRFIALRSAGFNNVDLAGAEKLKMTVMRVPAYSLHGTYRHSAQEIGPTSRLLRALRQDLPEFVTFHSARRGTRGI
jgi:D-lactate dehydrogenase